MFPAREDEEDEEDEYSGISEHNVLEKYTGDAIEEPGLVSLDSEDNLLRSQFSATPGSPTIVPKRRKKGTSSENTSVEKKIQKVPFLLVEGWIFDTYSLHDSARAVSIGETGWHEIDNSGHIKLVSYAMNSGFNWNHI